MTLADLSHSPLAALLKLTDAEGHAVPKQIDAQRAPKLKTEANYSLWRQQFVQYVDGFGAWEVLRDGIPGLPTTVLGPEGAAYSDPTVSVFDFNAPVGDRAILQAKLMRWVWSAVLAAISDVPTAASTISSVPRANAHEAWRRLEERFVPKSLIRRSQLEKEYTSMIQLPNETIEQFANRLERVVADLQLNGGATNDSQARIRFVQGIRVPPGHARDTLMYLSKTLQETIAMAVDMEREASGGRSSRSSAAPGIESVTASANAASIQGALYKRGARGQSTRDGRGGARSYDTCNYCGKTGHWASECGQNPDSPNFSGGSGRRGGAGGRRGRGGRGGGGRGRRPAAVCSYCGLLNHSEFECRRKASGKPRASSSNSGSASSYAAQAAED